MKLPKSESRYFSCFALVFFSCLSPTLAAVHGNSEVLDEDKPAFIADTLVKNPHLAIQIWNIGAAALSLFSYENGNAGPQMDQKTKNNVYNYILDSLPKLLENEVFQNVTRVSIDEISKAYSKSDVAKNVTAFQTDNGTFTDEVLTNVLKNVNVVRLLQRSIEEGKPVIDDLRGNDSTVFIGVVNYLIGMTPVVWKDPSFQKVKAIVTEELTLGYNQFTKVIKIPGTVLAKQNSTLLVQGVLKFTNIQRMLIRSLAAAKPVIDRVRGKDSTVMLMGLGFLAKEYPIVMADERYQHVQAVVSKYVSESFHRLNYSIPYLQQHQNEVIQAVIANTSKLNMIQDILRGGSARDVLPLTGNDDVNDVCYRDSMDSVDSLVEMSQWALKMFDSMGKVREGLLQGQLNLLGSFDECLTIKASITEGTVLGNRTKTYASSFGTRFCRVSTTVPASVLPIDTKGIPVHLTWGVCVPDSCHSRDIEGMFHMETIRNMTSVFEDVHVYCFDSYSLETDKSAIAALAVLGVFAFLIICGTLYVAITQYKPVVSEPENNYELTKLALERQENAYSNIAYTPSDVEISVDSSLTNGKVDSGNLPKGYMPHAENGTITTNGNVGNGNISANGNVRNGKPNVEQNGSTVHKTNEKPKVPKKKEGVIVRILKAFALQINAPKILSGKISANSITCLHGIRFLSLTWVILGHTFNYGIVSIPSLWTTENIVKAADLLKRFTFQAVIAGGFAVDTFYMISGMLLTYLQVKQVEKLQTKFNCGRTAGYVFNYYFHRIWRLTPMYMMVMMIYSCLMRYIGDGPLWPEAVKSADDCKTNWWTNILYVNNVVNVNDECMAWSWFLANDMQFYVISLFFLVFLAISIPVGVILVFLLMAGGVASAWYEESIYNGNFFSTKSDNGGYWNNVYIAPWCRISPFCVGMLLGVLLYKRPKKPVKTKWSVVGWALATAMGLALVYGTYSENKEGGTEWSREFRSAYESLGRPLWAACVGWVVFACHNGNGGFVDSLLSWSGLVPLSRMSYAAYLVHPIMMMIHVYSKRALVYIDDYEITYLFLGHTCFTFMVAFVVSISFEAPFMALEKIIMRL